MKTLKNGKKIAIKFDRKCKNAKLLNKGVINEIYYKLRNRGGLFSIFSQISFH